MTAVIVDASALLAFLLQEPGAEHVAARLRTGMISAANYTDALTRTTERGKPLATAVADIVRLRLDIVPFDAELAVVAASLRPLTRPFGLSLADRACLALGLARGLPVLTADRVWTELGLAIPVECIR